MVVSFHFPKQQQQQQQQHQASSIESREVASVDALLTAVSTGTAALSAVLSVDHADGDGDGDGVVLRAAVSTESLDPADGLNDTHSVLNGSSIDLASDYDKFALTAM